MNANELGQQVEIEFRSIERALAEISSLDRDLSARTPTTREVAAAGMFLASLYNGVENVLKRLWSFHGSPLPAGENWHIELFKGFCEPPRRGLPILIDKALEADLAPFRRLRHVVRHSYGFQLRWDQLRPGLQQARQIFQRFSAAVQGHLKSIETQQDKEMP